MRAYLVITGVIFFLIVVAHIARAASEGSHLAAEPSFVLLTALALGMSIWAGVLFRRAN
jgi:hypothetical protein